MLATYGRSLIIGFGAAVLLLTATAEIGRASDPVPDSPVLGRFAVVSEAGGAVWAFQPGGALLVAGPGELVAEGAWTDGPGEGEFDGQAHIDVTGQDLTVLGAVSPDGVQVALYVQASEPTAPENWAPWPPESRLIGNRVGIVADETPRPTPAPPDCLRPSWGSDTDVDWDPCGNAARSPGPQGVTGPEGAPGSERAPGTEATPAPLGTSAPVTSPQPDGSSSPGSDPGS